MIDLPLLGLVQVCLDEIAFIAGGRSNGFLDTRHLKHEEPHKGIKSHAPWAAIGEFLAGETSLLTVGACLLKVALLCLQCIQVIIRGTFPL